MHMCNQRVYTVVALTLILVLTITVHVTKQRTIIRPSIKFSNVWHRIERGCILHSEQSTSVSPVPWSTDYNISSLQKNRCGEAFYFSYL